MHYEGQPLIEAKQIAYQFSGEIIPLFSGIDMVLNAEQHALVGRNGIGKSWLASILTRQIPPTEGSVNHFCDVGYLSQGLTSFSGNAAEMDQHFSFLDKNQSALHNFQLQSPGWPEDRYRTRLAQLRIRGEEALKPVGCLSGGEQLKVALACLFCGPYAPALLLLDEPDNHLDIESRELLQKALHGYTGAMVLISHDAQFIANIGNMQELLLGSSEDFLHKKTLKSFSER
ncbi:ATP-binding cassette domain-containing protein [Xenorhabdus bovienii]|uniref:ATP-binding cassette domain-containing protein n=1 Tax=Xenorhabdus bovienii TaxID=40576 RepID=UPI00237C7633|nr:ATP-binding cassette domain-containing protein [Xenorhabdus bovienii]MDE1485410.1 ATP-binding cassette domain-containing protein [Xenorhabdus bovienii]MDE9476210.1 ATP-binding cassette domain-containing protein [Xenorhabdus bovienii]MDE9516437.1 ATP-binding cassette domain-containing protein [Xenorhabdus bovienii]MDE9529089.1 ATP-binding cassette domain-containing protein [Xenorhabdus bovienii]